MEITVRVLFHSSIHEGRLLPRGKLTWTWVVHSTGQKAPVKIAFVQAKFNALFAV